MIYGAGGELVAEYTSAGTAAPKEYGYRDGQMLITASPNLDAQAQSNMVVHLYQTILNRTPSTSEVQYWLNQGLTNVDAFKSVARQMFDSQEYINRNRTDREFVYDCYEAYLYREPDQGGWDFWTGLVPSQGRVNIRENGFASSQEFADRVARTLAGETLWMTADQLGTPRIISDASGSLANIKRHDYLPFGEEIGTGVGGRTTSQGYSQPDGLRFRFTSKERDDETGLDYFLARYYSSTMGRFTSPDEFKGGPRELFVLGSGHPEKQALPYADITNPQSLNKYQYALNNPLRYVDPDGHIPLETAIDVVSFAHSFYELVKNPSWAALGYVVWDGLAVAVPYAPGSWVAKVGRYGHQGLEAAGIVKKLDDFETVVNNNFVREGVALLGQGEKSVRKALGISDAVKTADFLGVTASGTYKIAETKGSDLLSGIRQLDNTAKALVAKVGDVRFTAEIVLRRELKGKDIPGFQIRGNQLHRYEPGLFNEKTGEWGGWVLQKANGKPITVRYQ